MKKNLEQLKLAFLKKHGETYCYDLVNDENYKDGNSSIPIICNEHGVFFQRVYKHLAGHGCQKCAVKRRRKSLIYGVATNDLEISVYLDDATKKAYDTWRLMLDRCYSSDFHKRQQSYKDCSVCNDWLLFSNFKKWFDVNYVSGYQLDKDILVKGNRVYSPQTCCFIPQRINSLFTKQSKAIRKGIVGVTERYNGKFLAYYTKNKKNICIGTYDTQEEAFEAYKMHKENYIKEIAQEYFDNGMITEQVYQALMNYEVEITD